jgi:hypothetical protein
MATAKILPEDIASEQQVVHPALDWRDNTLLMGLKLDNGKRGVLTSTGQIILVEELPWPTCDRGRHFDRSPVTTNVAQRFQAGYGTATDSQNPYALVNVPNMLAAYYRRFMVFPETWWPDVLALWTLGTYLYPVFSAYPYLRISSPEPGCGKSLLGEIIAHLSFNGELMASPTEANIFRMAESERGTQVWDEVENQSEGDRGRLQAMKSALLNGYRAGGNVPRQERTRRGQFETVRFHVYVPRVLIGLSDLPPVVRQRTIELLLHRRSTEEKAERYLPDQRAKEEQSLREMCALYAMTYCRSVSEQYRRPDLAERLERHIGQAGRLPNDLLLPLVAVCAGAITDQSSREAVMPLLNTLFLQAAPNLSRGWNEEATTTPPWLPAALNVMEELHEVTPADLAQRVSEGNGMVISAEQLSHRLKKYGISSTKSNGTRVFRVTEAQIARLRLRYDIAKPDDDEPEALLLPEGH